MKKSDLKKWIEIKLDIAETKSILFKQKNPSAAIYWQGVNDALKELQSKIVVNKQ